MEHLVETVTTPEVAASHPSPAAAESRTAAGECPDPRDKCRLFMGNLPKVKTEKDICEEVSRITAGLVRVITYKNFEDPTLHRGFCFLDYESAALAADAKRCLAQYTVFGCKTIVDWADPEPEIDERMMANVRILFVRQYSGMLDEGTLAEVFGEYGTVERVKNLKNYAFVHFARREDAQAAMNALDGAVDADSGVKLDVSWAKPPTDKQTRERMLRDRERRMQQATTVAKFPLAFPVRFASTSPAKSANPAPYSAYDHYVYDFGQQTLRCACQQADVGSQFCHRGLYCPCAMAVASAAAVAKTNNDCDDYEYYENYDDYDDKDGVRQQQQQERRRADNVVAATRHDHGDCADNSNVDANILKFFYKVTINGVKPPADDMGLTDR